MPSDNTERVGVNAVEAIFLGFKWVFRPQPISDYGIDAQVEIWEDGAFTGKLIALQIKGGASYFRRKGSDYIFYGELKHLDYWTRHPLPVFLILHDPTSGLTLWQKIEHRRTAVTETAWSIVIPAANILDAQNKHYLSDGIASDPESMRRFNLAIDLPTMQLLRDKEVYFQVIEWVNKTINIRGVEVFFDELGKDKYDLKIPYWGGYYTVPEFMATAFPWLDYEYGDTDEALGGEVEVHTLHVWVNDLGGHYLAIENYFANGLPEPEEPEFLDYEDPTEE